MRWERCWCSQPPLDARPHLAGLNKGAARVALRYEWVKNWDAFNALCETSGWHLSDGQEWVSLFRTVPDSAAVTND